MLGSSMIGVVEPETLSASQPCALTHALDSLRVYSRQVFAGG